MAMSLSPGKGLTHLRQNGIVFVFKDQLFLCALSFTKQSKPPLGAFRILLFPRIPPPQFPDVREELSCDEPRKAACTVAGRQPSGLSAVDDVSHI